MWSRTRRRHTLPAFSDEIDGAFGGCGSAAHAGEKGGVFSHELGADGKEKMVVDAAHTAVLRLVKGRWKVVKDWLHGDVLTREEMVPKGEKAFPQEILPNWYE